MKYIKHMMLTLLITASGTLVMAHTTWAVETYYVSTNGEDTGPGTRDSPWKTLAYAAGKVSPGDTVLIAKGTYQPFRIARGGKRSSEVTFKADSGAQRQVIISGNDTYGVAAWNADYVVVDGLVITGNRNTGFLAYKSDFVTLRNSEITGIGRACVHFPQSSFGRVDRNIISNCGNQGPNGEGIYLGSTGAGDIRSRGHVVRNNTISNTKDEAIDLKPNSQDILCDNNTIFNIQLHDGGAIHVRGSGHVIRNNTITNVRRGSELGPGILAATESVVLSNNTMNQTTGCQGIGCSRQDDDDD